MGDFRTQWTDNARWTEAGPRTAEDGAEEIYEGRRGRRDCGDTDT